MLIVLIVTRERFNNCCFYFQPLSLQKTCEIGDLNALQNLARNGGFSAVVNNKDDTGTLLDYNNIN